MSKECDGIKGEKRTPLDDLNFRRRALWVRERCDEGSQQLEYDLEDIFRDIGIGSNDASDNNAKDEGHEEELQHHKDESGDNARELQRLRAQSNARNREILVKNMQLRILCRVMEWKQAELEELMVQQVRDIRRADTILHSENRVPRLPVEIILRIFSMLYWADRRFGTIKIFLDDPDTPQGWRSAIRNELPLVIAEAEEHIKKCILVMGLGPKPAFFPLDGDLDIATHQSNHLSLAMATLPADDNALRRALQLPLHQLTLRPDVSYQSNFILHDMLSECWETIPKVHKLVVQQDAPFSRNYEEAIGLTVDHGDLGDFEDWKATGKNSFLRVAVIPMVYLQLMTPVANLLEELELSISQHVIEFSALEATLKLLPASLRVLKLCDNVPHWKDPPRFADAEPRSNIKLSNLKEFRLIDFTTEVGRALMKTIVCPQLEIFSYDAVKRFERDEEPFQLSFINDMYRNLRVLYLYSSDLMRKPSILEAFLDPDEDGKWLFPNVDTLIFRAFAVDVLEMLTRVVEARLDCRDVASIQSLTIKESSSVLDDHLLNNLYLGNLSLLVPNMVFLTYRDEFNY